MVIAAVLGAGRGARMGADLPKQFLPLGGKPVFMHSLTVLKESGLVDEVLLLVPEEYLLFANDALEEACFTTAAPVHILTGGATRSGSLLRALEFTKAAWGLENNILITHDAARPFVTRRMIEENIALAEEYGAVNTCVPATDTVFLSEDGRFISAVPARKNVFHAQTPQTFRADTLCELIGALPPGVFDTLTDGCSVFTYSGRKVAMAQGSETNIKITYPQDLARAEGILKNMQ